MIIMMLRFFAALLIPVCFMNSAAFRAEASSIAKQGVKRASFPVQDSAGATISSANLASKVSAPLSYEDTNTHNDCDQNASCHHCHLGHCQFLIAATDSLHAPLGTAITRHNDEQRFKSLEIPSPIRPPIS